CDGGWDLRRGAVRSGPERLPEGHSLVDRRCRRPVLPAPGVRRKEWSYSTFVSEGVDVAGELRAEGLRVTAPRVAVLAGLREQGEHLRVNEIVERVRLRLRAVSLQAVYNALAALAEVGLVRR